MTCPFKQKEAKSKTFRFVTSKAALLLGRYLIRDPKPLPSFLGGLRSQFHISKAGSEEISTCTCPLAWKGSLTALEVATPTSCPPQLTGEAGTFAKGFQMGITQHLQAEHTATQLHHSFYTSWWDLSSWKCAGITRQLPAVANLQQWKWKVWNNCPLSSDINQFRCFQSPCDRLECNTSKLLFQQAGNCFNKI